MMKKLTILLLTLMLTASALAEAYEGTTALLSTVVVTASASGIVQSLDVEVGSRVEAGEAMVSLKPERVFAAQDGSISLVNATEGDRIDGTLLELMPLERYLIYCTVSKAYQSAESTLPVFQGPLKKRQYIVIGKPSELVYQPDPREDRVVYGEIRVLRRTADEPQDALLKRVEKGILL